jgi:hypothetical protein
VAISRLRLIDQAAPTRLGDEMLQFGFGDPDQPGEAVVMFGSEIRNFEKQPAMFDNSALALKQESLDARRKSLKFGRRGAKPEARR